ncbi:hypothetical protein [Marinifilum flexuosum]|uniref:Uncharacterized protein n=1 Tax=Marinifilum flexuosum TaxID=1117708 RepID=A0A419X8V2_9BACT|nr:hypothetical protein [Marinifilum flexuosum]RKE04171.1 hypothetical protein BXY64_1187 [Marinifilum flexuosum]
MKIEIAENLVYTYLKHSEGCRVTQTNWKTSGQWTTNKFEEKPARELYERIMESPKLSTIFKESKFDQLIKQAEIDVLGLNTTEHAVYGIDIAFHSAGLNYGPPKKTAEIVLKKIIRTIFIMQTYFNDFKKFHSFFVTPKVYQSTEKPILELMEEAKSLLKDEMISIDFIANDDFYKTLVDPVIESVSNENDTAELFSRAYKLLQLDKRIKISESSDQNKSNTIKRLNGNTSKRTEEGMKIGQFVQYKMKTLYEQNKISEKEIINLQDMEYSRKVFNQTYEVLRSKGKDIKGNDGRTRYYATNEFCGDYFMTAQWTEKHWEPFLSWLRKMEKNEI